MKFYALLVLILLCISVVAQNINIEVKVNSGRTAVSPYLYGRNNSFSDASGSPTSSATFKLYKEAGLRFSRECGGNNSTKYNWRKKLSSHPDWYNNVYSHDWDYASKTIQTNMPGFQTMWSFQLIGKAAANKNNNFNDWSYNQSQWWSGCAQNLAGGGQVNASGGNKATKEGDPAKYLMNWNADSTTAILSHFFGSGGLGLNPDNFSYWNMDNEPEIWNGTHDDVIPQQIPADSFMTLYFETAKKARALYPSIKLVGPVPANEWQWFKWGEEALKINGQYYCWLEYFIKRIADEQKATGIKLLDVLDLHFYPYETADAQVVQLHRVFFDKSYVYPGVNGIKTITGGWDSSQNKEYIMQRIRDWLNKYIGTDHGVGLAVTEMDTKASNPNIRAVTYASILGTFANQGVEVFTPWSWEIGMWEVLHLFSRYSREISVSTTSSLEATVSGYSTCSAPGDSLTIILVNRDLSAARTANVQLSDFGVKDGSFASYTLSSLPSTETFKSHTSNALKKNSVKVTNQSFSITLPALSATAIVLHSYETLSQKFEQQNDLRLISHHEQKNVTLSAASSLPYNSILTVYFRDGKKIESFSWDGKAGNLFTFSTAAYPPGPYFLKITNPAMSCCRKFLVH